MRRFLRLLGNVWVRRVFMVLGVIGLIGAIWFGFEMLPWAFFRSVLTRAITIGVLLGGIALYYGLRWRKRRKAAEALEESLMPKTVGDGKVLAERMNEALARLKKTGGKTYLYDLPWYIIIGPPGAGKTTALRFSGIEFPGQDALPDHGHGFGGTRNCDWWFAEDAVLIDTAGRYVTQDSDAEADRESWTAFLDLLKKGRPDQPVNGVILAFSVEDMMNGTPESLKAHAEVVRARLAEIHETLRIDFPVYVLFTKADLISGFREYFASFNQTRRNGVWGVTFQTRDRKEQTHDKVPEEFDALLSRLSDEVIDRLSEEPDAISRIAIFGLPGQMAMLREGVTDFLRRVFEPTRYKTNAILRGFYFTSGTQEGNPIDQVLGAMARDAGPEMPGFQPDFMSGKGKSFFLRDLLEKVIFAERDWVNYDRGAVRRMTVLRTLSLTVIGVVTAGAMAAFGYSFWQNATLVRSAEAHAAVYLDDARNVLGEVLINDSDPTPVLDHLAALRNIPGGPDNPRERTFWEGFGLSRHAEVTTAAREAYSDGLERMLRPRMMLHLQQEIPQMIANDAVEEAYQALKVYLLLGGQGPVGKGDEEIASYFETVWRDQLSGSGRFEDREALKAHLAAMLEMDGERTLTVLPEEQVVRRARQAIADLSLEEQAWAAIQSGVATAGIAPFNLVDQVEGQVRAVFQTDDGTDLGTLVVPALYTYQGYWGYFVNEMATARQRLEDDQWVLGEVGENANYEQQLANLENALFRRYRLEFKTAWDAMFARLDMARMSADAPAFDVLGFVSAEFNSPLLALVKAVDAETRMTRLYDQLAAMSPEDAARVVAAGQGGGSLAGNLGDAGFNRLYARSGVFQRVALDYLKTSSGGKVGARAGAGGALSEDVDRRRADLITSDFALWHALLQGEVKQRPIDQIIAALDAIRENRVTSSFAASPADDAILNQALAALTRNNGSRPAPVAQMLNKVEGEFRAAANDATMVELNQKLVETVTLFCRDNIKPFFPFSQSNTHLSPSIFGQFFAPGGLMDQYYSENLQPHVLRTANGLAPDPASPLGARISRATLRQFDRAQKIQQAFFASGSPEPKVQMSIQHLASSPSVGLATLTIHGERILTQPNSTPAKFTWPGGTSGVAIELTTNNFLESPPRLEFSRGRWDIVTFLQGGRARGKNVIDVTKNVQGASITYRFEFDSPTIPFLMTELREFNCPASLE